MDVLMKQRHGRRGKRPIREAQAGTKNAIAIGTGTWADGPVRVDFGRLDDGEAHELVELTDAAASGMSFDLSKLDRKQRGRWEALVEQASPLGPGWFARTRREAKMSAELQALIREAERPTAPKVADEVRLWLQLHDLVAAGSLHLDRVAIFVYLLGQLLTGQAIVPRGRFEGAGDARTLVFSRSVGLGGSHDPNGNVSARKWEALGQLDKVGLLEVERSGDDMRVRLGWRTLRAFGRPTAAPRAAA
jgi:hypothetical protein